MNLVKHVKNVGLILIMSKAREAFQLLTKPLKNIKGRIKGVETTVYDHMKVEIDTVDKIITRDEAEQVLHENMFKSFGKCPVCNSSVAIRFHRQFCGECGKALEWNSKCEKK